jgi:hypothetical protein
VQCTALHASQVSTLLNTVEASPVHVAERLLLLPLLVHCLCIVLLQEEIYCSSYSAAAYLDSIGFERNKKVCSQHLVHHLLFGSPFWTLCLMHGHGCKLASSTTGAPPNTPTHSFMHAKAPDNWWCCLGPPPRAPVHTRCCRRTWWVSVASWMSCRQLA